eukprot:5625928-Prymnesium_polylepis.2
MDWKELTSPAIVKPICTTVDETDATLSPFWIGEKGGRGGGDEALVGEVGGDDGETRGGGAAGGGA